MKGILPIVAVAAVIGGAFYFLGNRRKPTANAGGASNAPPPKPSKPKTAKPTTDQQLLNYADAAATFAGIFESFSPKATAPAGGHTASTGNAALSGAPKRTSNLA